MKRIIEVILLLIVFQPAHAQLFGFLAKADTVFTGEVEYEISYEATGLMDEEFIKLQPQSAEFIFKGNRSRTSMEGVELKQVTYADGYENTLINVLYVYDEYYGAIKKEQQDIQVELAKTPPAEVTYTNETKVIQGLTCKKAIVKYYDEFGYTLENEVYYYEHPDLDKLNFYSKYRAISGLLMEYKVLSGSYILSFKAIDFKKKRRIKEKEFEIPEGIEFSTLKELNDIINRGYE